MMDLSIDSNCIEAMPVVNGAALKQCPADRAYVESRSRQAALQCARVYINRQKALRRELVLLVLFSTPEQMQHSESHYSQPAPGTSSTTTSPTGKAVLLLLQSDRNPSHAHTHGRHWTVRDDPDPDQEALTVAQSRGAVSEDTNDSSKKKSLKRLLLHDYLSLQGFGGSIHQLLHLVWVRPDDLPHHLLALDEEERRHGLHSVPG